MTEISLDNLSVTIGMPTSRDLNPLVVKSLLASQQRCFQMGIPFNLALMHGNAIIQWARDGVIDLFLESGGNRLFWIDSDIIWTPDDFITMLALSQVKDVVCASYPAKKEPATFYVNWDQEKELVQDEYGLVEIIGAGLGFTVMSRDVVNKLVDNAPKIRDEITGRDIAEIFKVGTVDGKRLGEDMYFFRLLKELGYTVNLYPHINLGHTGTKTYTGVLLDALEVK